MLAKIIGNELGNREGWSFLTNLTTLLYYLIHSLLPCLADASKDNGNKLSNREGWSISSKMTTLLYYPTHSLLSLLASAKKGSKALIRQ